MRYSAFGETPLKEWLRWGQVGRVWGARQLRLRKPVSDPSILRGPQNSRPPPLPFFVRAVTTTQIYFDELARAQALPPPGPVHSHVMAMRLLWLMTSVSGHPGFVGKSSFSLALACSNSDELRGRLPSESQKLDALALGAALRSYAGSEARRGRRPERACRTHLVDHRLPRLLRPILQVGLNCKADADSRPARSRRASTAVEVRQVRWRGPGGRLLRVRGLQQLLVHSLWLHLPAPMSRTLMLCGQFWGDSGRLGVRIPRCNLHFGLWLRAGRAGSPPHEARLLELFCGTKSLQSFATDTGTTQRSRTQGQEYSSQAASGGRHAARLRSWRFDPLMWVI